MNVIQIVIVYTSLRVDPIALIFLYEIEQCLNSEVMDFIRL